MPTAADLPALNDFSERSKAVVKYLDNNENVPSGANHNLILLAWVWKYQTQWFEGLLELNRPIIRDPAFDPAAPPNPKDPLGLFEIVYQDDQTPVGNQDKQDLASRLRIRFLRDRDRQYVGEYEARTEPTIANTNAETERQRLAEVGRAKADQIYSEQGEVSGANSTRRNHP